MELRKSKNTIRKVIWCSCYGTKIREILQSGKDGSQKKEGLFEQIFFIKTTCMHSFVAI